ncbi:MAG: hypothetical protein IIB56_00525 [Planctomycetes bacterium]|nr:hypothetical protein [Planctomycetota bacterium]MCH8118703.1 hypothetical protein [Planctomycetota bacterium]
MSSQNEQKQSFEDTTSPLAGGKAKRAKDLPTEPAGAVQETSEIPKFDLAEQILAEQRKITAIRRKAPGKKPQAPDRQPQAESTDYAIKQPPSTRTSQRSAASQSSILSEQEQIIAEIVARDIEKLYRRDTSSLRNW